MVMANCKKKPGWILNRLARGVGDWFEREREREREIVYWKRQKETST